MWRRVEIYVGFEGICHFYLQDKFEAAGTSEKSVDFWP